MTTKEWFKDLSISQRYETINFQNLAKLRDELTYTQEVYDDLTNKSKDTKNLIEALKQLIKLFEKKLYNL